MATNTNKLTLQAITDMARSVQTYVTGQLYFSGLHDTPDGYQDGYFLKSSTTGIEYSQIIEEVSELPQTVEHGKLVSWQCGIYIGCNGTWNKIGGESISPPVEAPTCVTNLEEYNEYQEYKDTFLADQLGPSAESILNNGTRLSNLIFDVCLFPESSLEYEKNTVVIDQTKYKWGMFASPQTINISAQGYSDGQGNYCVFSEWTSSNANFGDPSSANTTVFVDTDLSITGSFECLTAPSRPSCDQVALHLQPDAGETIADKSSNNHEITVVGNTFADNTATLFGGGTMNFDGNGDYLTVNQTSTLNLGGDFTMEGWFYIKDQWGANGVNCLISQWTETNGCGTNWSLNVRRTTMEIEFARKTTSCTSGVILTDSFEYNTWIHIAVVGETDTNTIKMYVNGVKTQETITDKDTRSENLTYPIYIGTRKFANNGDPMDFAGQIQDLRISKKVVYTGNFAPPTNLLANLCPSQPSCDQVALHLQPADGEDIADKSSNNHQITLVDGATYSEEQSIFGVGAFKFTGGTSQSSNYLRDGSHLRVSASDDFVFDGDHTIEAWIWWEDDQNSASRHTETIFAVGGMDSLPQFGLSKEPSPAGSPDGQTGYIYWSGSVSSSLPITPRKWTHVAATRSGDTVSFYVDGVLIDSTSTNFQGNPLPTTFSFGSDTITPFIGLRPDILADGNVNNYHPFKGYIQDLRISKKVVYTGDFTLPTNLLANLCPSCDQVALHLQPADGETITDKSSNNHEITVVGNTFADNTATLFGGGTMNFDGDGDYLTVNQTSTLNLGGDFTMEGWFHIKDQWGANGVNCLISQWTDNNECGTNWSLNIRRTTMKIEFARKTTSCTSGVILTDSFEYNTWIHIAVVGETDTNTIKMYVNGVKTQETITDKDTRSENLTYPIYIGTRKFANNGDPMDFAGQIQDLRISKKVVYTGNFAPPTNLLNNPC